MRCRRLVIGFSTSWCVFLPFPFDSPVLHLALLDADVQVVMATGPMFANIRWGTYALFAALNGLVIFPSVYLFFPETKKYSLEDVSHLSPISLHSPRSCPLALLNNNLTSLIISYSNYPLTELATRSAR